MKYNLKFMITLLVLLSSLSAVGIVQSQENSLRITTGDMVLYENYGENSDIDISTIQINDLNTSDLLEYSSNEFSSESSFTGEISLRFAEIEDLTYLPFNPMDDPDFEMPEDMYMYGMSLSQMLEMEMSYDTEYSNYYLGDNSTGEWWNDTDGWEDSQTWSDTWFEFAEGTADYLFYPGYELMMENETITDTYFRYMWVSDFDIDLLINATSITTFETWVQGDVEYLSMNQTSYGSIVHGNATVPLDRDYGQDSLYVDVHVNATFTESHETVMKFDRSDALNGMFLGQTESGYDHVEGVFWNDNATIVDEDDLDYHGSSVTIHGEFEQAWNDAFNLVYEDSMLGQESTGVNEGWQVGDELHYVHYQEQSMYDSQTMVDPMSGESFTDEFENSISVTSDFYMTPYRHNDNTLSILYQEVTSPDGIDFGDEDSEMRLDDGHPEDFAFYEFGLWDGVFETSADKEFTAPVDETRSPQCMDMDFLYMGEPEPPEDDMFLDDHEGEDEPMGPMDFCTPMALGMLMYQTDLELEFEGMPLLSTEEGTELATMFVNGFEYVVLGNTVEYTYGLVFEGEVVMTLDPEEMDDEEMFLDQTEPPMEPVDLTVAYTITMTSTDFRVYDNATGAWVYNENSYMLDVSLDLSAEMPDGQVMNVGRMKSSSTYFDVYMLAGHESKYEEAQDPNSIPEDPNANTNATETSETSELLNETELPSEVPPGVSLPAGLPGFEGLYAMIALSVSIVFSRKFKRN
jgi:hypothetical protein